MASLKKEADCQVGKDRGMLRMTTYEISQNSSRSWPALMAMLRACRASRLPMPSISDTTM